MRERVAMVALLLLGFLGAVGAGLSLMTHMHHRGLEFIAPGAMAAYDAGYERLTDVTVIPIGVLGLACTLTLLALRPRGVPLWMIGLTLALQLFVLVARLWMWGAWADEVRQAGSIRLPDGAFHPAYLLYMDTNWMRIAAIFGYALLALAMAITAAREPRAGA